MTIAQATENLAAAERAVDLAFSEKRWIAAVEAQAEARAARLALYGAISEDSLARRREAGA